MKKLQKSMALVLALLLALSAIGVAAFAETTQTAPTIDKNAKGSITVTKYEYNGSEGAAGDGTATGTAPSGAVPLAGVTFTAYKVMDAEGVEAYYNGTASAAVTVQNYLTANGQIDTEKATEVGAVTTDDNGVAKFTDLPVGMYVIVETDSPDKVTAPAFPFLVSIPMTNPAGDDWMYDVYVYPKNKTSDGDITILKKGRDGAALDGVTFLLEKQNGDNWDEIEINGSKTLTTANGGKIELKDCPHGTYRITETKTLDGYILDGRPIQFTVSRNNTITCVDELQRATVVVEGSGNANLEITITNEKPEIKKELAQDQTGEPGVGDTVAYMVTVDVPKNITALKTFTVTDTPANLRLKVDTENPFTVQCDGNSVDSKCYTLATANTDGFVLTFVPAEMSAFAGKQLTLKYYATVLPGAATENKANNTAKLTYTDKIGTDSTHDIEDDEPVYNFRLDITKRKDSETGPLAEGVEFELYKDDAAIIFVKTGDIYVKDVNQSADASTTLKTDANGKLIVSGLAAGSYKLKEIKTVEGYNLLSKPIDIELKKGADGSYTVSQTVVNKKGFDLPRTGGMGTLLFITIGGVLVLGGVWLITAPGKKRKA